jgi:hypothetical protein
MHKSKHRDEAENILIDIAEVAEIVSDLEITHQQQLQFMKSLINSSWCEGLKGDPFVDISHDMNHMEEIGKPSKTLYRRRSTFYSSV